MDVCRTWTQKEVNSQSTGGGLGQALELEEDDVARRDGRHRDQGDRQHLRERLRRTQRLGTRISREDDGKVHVSIQMYM